MCRAAETCRDRSVKSWSIVPGPGQMPECSQPRVQRQRKGPRETDCIPPAPLPESSRQATPLSRRTNLHQACNGAAPQTPPASTGLLAPRRFLLQFALGREDRYPRPRAMTHTARGAHPRAQGPSSRCSPSAGARHASCAAPRRPSGSRKQRVALLSACCTDCLLSPHESPLPNACDSEAINGRGTGALEFRRSRSHRRACGNDVVNE